MQPEKAVGSVLIYVRNADAIGGVGEGGGGGGERSGGKGGGGAAGDERGAVRIRQLSAATEIALLHEGREAAVEWIRCGRVWVGEWVGGCIRMGACGCARVRELDWACVRAMGGFRNRLSRTPSGG